jgi:tetratricopeptide (TPR) repeat protein
LSTRNTIRIACIAALASLVFLAGPWAAASASADDLKDGRAALQAARYDDALKSFEKAASQGFAAGRAGVGQVWLRRRQLDKAMEAFQLAQKMDPGLETSYWGQGEVLRRQGKCQDAIPLFRKATELNRKYPDAQLALGDCLVETKQHVEAVQIYSEGLKWGGKWGPRFLVGLGNAEASRDSLRDAGIYFTRAREQAPTDPDVRQALGDFYFHRGTWALAILEYQAAMALDTADVELHYNLAQALYYDKRYNDALGEYQAAVARDPAYSPAQFGLGNLLYLSGAADPRRYEEARPALQAYTKLEPNDPKGWSMLGRLYYKLHQKDEALAAMNKAQQLGDRSKEMYTQLGMLYADQKKYPEALDAFSKGELNPQEKLVKAQVLAFTQHPASAESVYREVIGADSTTSQARFAMNEVGKLRFAQKDWTGALQHFQRRIALDPSNAEAYYYSGLSYKQLDQLPDAARSLEQATALDTSRADRFFWLGVVYDQQKRTPDARKAFERAVTIDPNGKLSAKAWAQLGFYRLLDKDWSGAVQQLERATQIDAQDVQSWVWLGQANQNSGNRTKAMEAYRRALAINPSQPDALKGVKMLTAPAGGGSKGGGS